MNKWEYLIIWRDHISGKYLKSSIYLVASTINPLSENFSKLFNNSSDVKLILEIHTY